ncbi:MAG TPA: hypothetical protein VFZ53_27240, partial [Polyangiaceae bacterium]
PRRIICGAIECFPDQTRCVGEDGEPGGDRLATCNARGAWGPPVLCDRGLCTEDDQQASGTAACEDECIPRSKTCVDATNQATCGTDARYGAPETCLTRTACIAESAALARLGCVECVPRDPADPERVPDSRCDADELEVCGLDGRWATAIATTCPYGCTGTQAGATTPGAARARCLPLDGGGGQAGSGGGAGSGGTGAGNGGAGNGGAGSGGQTSAGNGGAGSGGAGSGGQTSAD